MQTLQDLLSESGLTKTQLAKLSGLSRSTITRYGDHITDEVRKVVADYLGKPVDTDMETVPLPADLHVDTHARKEPGTYTDDDIRVLLKRRGQGEADYAVAGCIKSIGRCHTS